MPVASLTRPELIFPNLEATHGEDLLRRVCTSLAEQGVVDEAEPLFRRLWEREQLGSTGIGSGVAIPHCKVSGLDRVVLSVATVPNGIEFGAVDKQPVRVFFVLLSPPNAPTEHLRSLAEVSRWIKSDEHSEKLLSVDSAQEIFQLLSRES